MIPYIFTFFLILFFSFTQFTRELKKYKLLFLLSVSLYLVFFAGLRKSGVGEDDQGYIDIYLNIHNILDYLNGKFIYSMEEINMEYGYVLINSFIKYFTDTYTILFLIVAFFSISINTYNYNKYSKYVFLTILLYFVHIYLYKDLNQIRAGLSGAIILFSIKFIDERKDYKAIAIILLASVFHLSSFIVLFILLLRNILNTKKSIFILLILSITISSFGIGHFLLNNLPNLGVLTIKLNYYLEYNKYNYNLGIFDITNIKNMFFLILFLILWNRLNINLKYFKTLILFFAIGVSIRLIFSDFAIIAGRLSSILTLVEVILIPSLITCFKNKLFIAFIIIIYAGLILMLNLQNSPFGSGIYETSIF